MHWIVEHVQYLVLALATAVGYGALLLIPSIRRCRRPLVLVGLALVATLACGYALIDHAAEGERRRLRQMIQDLPPVYAMEMREQHHASITPATAADDPRYLHLIDLQKQWLAINQNIADIYTFRADADGTIRLLVDSETDYDRSGAIDADREHRTDIGEVYEDESGLLRRALAGEAVFGDTLHTDRWGTWVSAAVPIYGADGRVEAGLGVDFPAEQWVAMIAMRKWSTAAVVGLACLTILTAGAVVMLLQASLHQRAEAERELIRQKRFVDEVLDQLPMALLVKDVQAGGRFIIWNRKMAEASGHTREQVAGKTDYDLFPREQADFFAETDAQVVRSRQPADVVAEPLDTPRGTVLLRTRKVPLFNEDGSPRALLAMIEDVTSQVRFEQYLRDARDSAEAASRLKSEFLANMSHEIRTPMTAILGFTDLLRDPDVSPTQRDEYVNTIHRNGQHLLSVLNDILDLSKIEAGQLVLERAECQPRQLLADVDQLMRVRADEKQVVLKVTCDADVPMAIRTDSTRLKQVLLNLVGNAIKFTERGSVTVRAHVEGQILRLDVTDTGIGMDEQTVARLFKPFMQADGSHTRKFGGTGLGLSISHKLAHLLGGDLVCRSEPGKGSVFTFSIPMDMVESTPAAQASTVEPVAPTSAPTPAPAPAVLVTGKPLAGMRILLAEDGVDNRKLIHLHLRNAGATVTLVGDGQEAADAVLGSARTDAGDFDLVLMDMQMPVLDGYAATTALRTRGYRGRIVGLTAHAMESDRQKCLAAGCDEYLTKPIDRARLIAAVTPPRAAA